MSFDANDCAIIACDVFKDELEAFGMGRTWNEIVYLEMGLHDQPDILRIEIQKVIDRIEQNPTVKTILLLYGICGNGLVGIRSGRCRLVLPRAHDCVSILMGGPDTHQAFLKKHPGAYFYSPGWIRGKRVPGPDREARLKEYYSEKYPDDEDLLEDLIEADHETFAHHDCAAYVDVTGNAAAERYCRDCAASLGWEYRHLEGDPGMIVDLLSGNWDSRRFLVTQPTVPISGVLDEPGRAIQG